MLLIVFHFLILIVPHIIFYAQNNFASRLSLWGWSTGLPCVFCSSFSGKHISKAEITLKYTFSSFTAFLWTSFQFSVSFARDGGMSWTLPCFWESRHSCKLDQTNQVSGFPGCRHLIDFLYKVPLQSTAHTLHHTLSPTDICLPDHWVQGHLHDLAHQLLLPFLPCFHFHFFFFF